MDIGTLREFEQQLLSQRSTAASRESWKEYADDLLPSGNHPQIQQGFEAGYDAAMNRVRRMLTTLQGQALAEARQPGTAQREVQHLQPGDVVLNDEMLNPVYTVLEMPWIDGSGALRADVRFHSGGFAAMRWSNPKLVVKVSTTPIPTT